MSRQAPRQVQPPGTRAIHIIHAMFSKGLEVTVLNPVKRVEYPGADEVSLQLREGQKQPVTMTLAEALQRVEPSSYLAEEQAGTEENPGIYRIRKLVTKEPGSTKKGPLSHKYYKRLGRSKEVHLTTVCPPSFLQNRLATAYRLLLEGTRLEFHLHQPSTKLPCTVDWALAHRLHMRPDALMAAMPAGTTMLAPPGASQFNGHQRIPRSAVEKYKIFWALEHPESLAKVGASTPGHVKKRAHWAPQPATAEQEPMPHGPASSDPPAENDPDAPLSDLLEPEGPKLHISPDERLRRG